MNSKFNLDAFSNLITLLSWAFYFGMLVITIAYLIKLFKNYFRINLINTKNNALCFTDYLLYLSIIGLLSNLFVLILTNTNEGGTFRTWLWAVFLLYIAFMSFIVSKIKIKKVYMVSFAVFNALIFSFSIYKAYNFSESQNRNKYLEGNINPIKQLIKEHNIRRIYGGNFWEVMPLNVYASPIYASYLIIDNNKITIQKWLTRQDSACTLPNENVLYVFNHNEKARNNKDFIENEKTILSITISNGAKLILSTPTQDIYIGKSIVDPSDCPY
ncbi:MAG: phosphoethanolamine transferase CptA [Alphaproteobacteria bacterium]|nr:phosphoethanolamine transferase CptA [Alphaproteobacteria bacterium]